MWFAAVIVISLGSKVVPVIELSLPSLIENPSGGAAYVYPDLSKEEDNVMGSLSLQIGAPLKGRMIGSV